MKFTIITPSLNQASTIEQTIQSVAEWKKYLEIQYILVDGNSTDGSIRIIKAMQSFIDILIIEHDQSQAEALNKAFSLAVGDVIGWINADDYLLPSGAAAVKTLIQKQQEAVAWVGATLVLFDNKQEIHKPWIHDSGMILNWGDKSHFFQPSCFFSRPFFSEVGGTVREDLKCVFDVELWMRLAKLGPIARTDQLIAAARVYPATITERFPLRREIEFMFINFLHYGYDECLERLNGNTALNYFIVQQRCEWDRVFSFLVKYILPALRRIARLFAITKNALGASLHANNRS